MLRASSAAPVEAYLAWYINLKMMSCLLPDLRGGSGGRLAQAAAREDRRRGRQGHPLLRLPSPVVRKAMLSVYTLRDNATRVTLSL